MPRERAKQRFYPYRSIHGNASDKTKSRNRQAASDGPSDRGFLSGQHLGYYFFTEYAPFFCGAIAAVLAGDSDAFFTCAPRAKNRMHAWALSEENSSDR